MVVDPDPLGRKKNVPAALGAASQNVFVDRKFVLAFTLLLDVSVPVVRVPGADTLPELSTTTWPVELPLPLGRSSTCPLAAPEASTAVVEVELNDDELLVATVMLPLASTESWPVVLAGPLGRKMTWPAAADVFRIANAAPPVN